nr:aminopeptidase [Gemmatimonadaceae bacterium]
KGFFDFKKAKRTAKQLADDGLDVRLGPASAFSTLGWFDDPLVSTTARLDSVSLANTVIHEITHSTFFAKGKVAFNETFATFVGGQGAIAYFEAQGDSVNAEKARADWRDELRLAAFWGTLAEELQQAFDALPDTARAERLAVRERIYAAARARLVDSIGPTLETVPPGWAARVTLDNAVLLARRVYASRLDAFDAVHRQSGGALKASVQRLIAIAKAHPDDPIGAVVDAAKESTGTAPADSTRRDTLSIRSLGTDTPPVAPR